MEVLETKRNRQMTEEEIAENHAAYDKVKRRAAVKVHKWVMVDPDFWRAKADELVRWCEKTHVPNPLDDVRGRVDPKDHKVKPRQPVSGERSLRASYLACLILHDSCGDFEPICKWPTQPLPGKYDIPLTLEHGALTAFEPVYGDKTTFINLSLHAVKRDLGYQAGSEAEELIAAHLSGIINAARREGMTPAELDDMWQQVRENAGEYPQR